MSETKTVTHYEYRIVCDGKPLPFRHSQLVAARRHAGELEFNNRSVRIEKRQVTYGPWAAVEGAARGSEGEK